MFQNGPRGNPAPPPRPSGISALSHFIANAVAPVEHVAQVVQHSAPARAYIASHSAPAPLSQATLTHRSGRTAPVASFEARSGSLSPASRLASAIASSTNRRLLTLGEINLLTAQERAARQMWGGQNRAFLNFLDPITATDYTGPPAAQQLAANANMPSAAQQQQFRGIVNQDFTNLRQQGLLPKGAKLPPVNFVSGGPKGLQDARSYEEHGQIYFSPATVKAALDLRSPIHAWALSAPIHELAHTLQSPQTLSSVPVREGGAQAYADSAVPKVVGPITENDTNYSAYVQNVLRRKGAAQWVMRGQFGP